MSRIVKYQKESEAFESERGGGGGPEVYKKGKKGRGWPEQPSRDPTFQASSWVWKMGPMTTRKMALWTSEETQSAAPREVDGLLASSLLVGSHLSLFHPPPPLSLLLSHSSLLLSFQHL